MLALQQAIRGSKGLSSPTSLHHSQLPPEFMYSRPNPFGFFDPTAATSSSGGSYYSNAPSYNPSLARQRGPQSAAARLPEAVLLRLLSYCDEIALLDAALVCRYWLVLSRRVYFANF